MSTTQPASPQPPFTPGIQTLRGSCHCGAVRYEAEVDLAAGTTACNCTFCTKAGWWVANVKPAAFRLLAGKDRLMGFASKNPMVSDSACRTCGVRAFGHGNIPEVGGEFYSLNLRCLDDANLEGVSVLHLDGRHDTWAPLGTSVHLSPFPGAQAV